MTPTGVTWEHGRRSVVFPYLVVGVLVLSGACRERVPELTHALPSKEALAQAVVDALAEREEQQLAAFAITEREFHTAIWPRLPTSEPGVGMSPDYVWTDTTTRSRAHLARALDERGGRQARVEAVTFRGPATNYDGVIVHREAELTLREASGEVVVARLFGSMVEASGRWKVYSYIVD
jgi:hypothetical protein